MLIQTWAMLVDAYRELNSKKLFWITMLLSLLVVLILGMFGLNDRGLTILHWTFDNPMLNTRIIPADKFYIYLFATLAVPLWLTWAQTILALVSTATMFPDMMASGAIETVLSKPISRWRLFFTKYAAGLLFVTFQVLAFSFACFLLIGLRGGAWRPSLFLAVPIVVVFFSYLFAICAVLGTLTRSTIAALLLTILAWFAIFLVNTTDAVFIMQRESAILSVERLQQRIVVAERNAQERLDAMEVEGASIRDDQGRLPEQARDELEAANPFLRTMREQLPREEAGVRTWTTWTARLVALKTILPKTGETTALLGRYLLSDEERALIEQRGQGAGQPSAGENGEDPRVRRGDPELENRMDAAITTRSVGWVVGTSLAFEAVILVFGAWWFKRRDF